MVGSRVRRRALAFVVIAACAGMAALADAAGDERTAAESILKEVAASPKKEVANDLVARSRAALDRGSQLRTKGDEAHARLADQLAKTWAEAAREAAKAAVVEESATRARLDANDAGVTSERERALLEEAVAQSGRLRAQLEGTSAKDKEQPARTSAVANSDAGAPKPKAPAPAPAPGKHNVDGGAP